MSLLFKYWDKNRASTESKIVHTTTNLNAQRIKWGTETIDLVYPPPLDGMTREPGPKSGFNCRETDANDQVVAGKYLPVSYLPSFITKLGNAFRERRKKCALAEAQYISV